MLWPVRHDPPPCSSALPTHLLASSQTYASSAFGPTSSSELRYSHSNINFASSNGSLASHAGSSATGQPTGLDPVVDGADTNLQSSCHLRDGKFAGSCVGVGRWDAVDVTNPANGGYIERLTAARPQAGDIELGSDLMVGVTGQSLEERVA